MGVSRQQIYDIKKAYTDGGMPALPEKSRRKPDFWEIFPEPRGPQNPFATVEQRRLHNLG
jgi:hypothetical protein